jgi:hypothetical protein
MTVYPSAGGAGSRRPLLVVLAVAAVLSFGPRPANAATIPVSNTEALQNAVRDAGSGDTIVLAPGIYAPDAPLRLKVNLTLAGPTAEAPRGGPIGAIISGGNIEGGPSSTIIEVDRGASVTISNVSIRLASREGAAIFDEGTLSLDGVELSQNNSDAVIVVDDGAALRATNSTIAGNSGGAIYVAGKAELANATIVGNDLAGIFNEPGSEVRLTNTIVAKNGVGTSYSKDCYRAVDSSNSLDGDGSCKAALKGDPKLGPLVANGGPTLTMALLVGSPAIDAGSGCPANDQRLAPRGGACDIGAFEYGANAPAPKPATGSSSGTDAGSQTGTQPSGTGTGGGTGQPGPPSSGTGKPTASTAGKGKPKARSFRASGKIKTRNGRQATFQLRGTVGSKAGIVVFTDPLGKVRLRVTRIASISIDRAGATAKVRGTGLNLATGRKVSFRVSVAKGVPGSFAIVVGKGYSRSGRLISGRVSITA